MASEFIKDKTGIAVACGLPMPPAGKKTAQALKKRASLWAAVTEWINSAGKSGDGARCAVSGVRLCDMPPFPGKVKSGNGKGLWRRSEVEKWNDVRIGKKGNGKSTPHPGPLPDRGGEGGARGASRKFANNTPSAVHGDLPVQERPAEDGELFPTLSAEEIRERKKRRLDYLEDIYLHPGGRLNPMGTSFLKLNASELKELKAARPQLFGVEPEETEDGESTPHPGPLPDRGGEGGGSGLEHAGHANDPSTINSQPSTNDDGSPEIYGGQVGVANWINVNYQGRINTESGLVNAMAISRWLQYQNLPGGCREAFPPPHMSGRFNKARVRAWCEKYIIRSGLPQSLPVSIVDADAELKNLQLRRQTAEFEQWERSNSDKYMETAVVRSFLRGFGIWIGQQQDRLIEDRNGVRSLVSTVVSQVLDNYELRITNYDRQSAGGVLSGPPSAEKTQEASANPDGRKSEIVNRKSELLAAIDEKLVPLLQASNDQMKQAAAGRRRELMEKLEEERAEALKAKSGK